MKKIKNLKLFGLVMILVCLMSLISCNKEEVTKNITPEEKQEIAEATKPVAELEVQEIAKKQWETAKEFKPEVSTEMVYDKTKQEEYQVKINAEGVEPEAQVDFNKNGFYLSVFKSGKDGDIPDIETFDIVEKWVTEHTGSAEYRNNYKIKGNEVYPMEFGKGDFGAAFLVQDEDGVYPVIVRYGNTPVGNTNVIVPEMQVVKFVSNGEEFLIPSEYLITRITVQGKDIVITYGDGSKEHWQTTLSSNGDGTYYLKRIS